MAADPLETRNLAADPAFQPVRHDLRRCLACWMRETDDVLDMDRDTEFSPFQWRRLDKTAGWQ
jgi:hypothetical protein